MQVFACTEATQSLLTKFNIPFTTVTINGNGKKIKGIALTDSAIQAINALGEFLNKDKDEAKA